MDISTSIFRHLPRYIIAFRQVLKLQTALRSHNTHGASLLYSPVPIPVPVLDLFQPLLSDAQPL